LKNAYSNTELELTMKKAKENSILPLTILH